MYVTACTKPCIEVVRGAAGLVWSSTQQQLACAAAAAAAVYILMHASPRTPKHGRNWISQHIEISRQCHETGSRLTCLCTSVRGCCCCCVAAVESGVHPTAPAPANNALMTIRVTHEHSHLLTGLSRRQGSLVPFPQPRNASCLACADLFSNIRRCVRAKAS